MPILSDKEKDYVKRISAISKRDESAVLDVLKACLISGTLELLEGHDEISIPFVCDLKIDYNDKITKQGIITEVNLQATPNRALVEEIIAISDGEYTSTFLSFKKGIRNKLKTILDIVEDE